MVKQNLLDKSTALNLNIVTTKLLSVYNCIKREHNIEETEKKQKAKQLVLFVKSFSVELVVVLLKIRRNQRRASLSQDLLIQTIIFVARRGIRLLNIQKRGRIRLSRPNLVILLMLLLSSLKFRKLERCL